MGGIGESWTGLGDEFDANATLIQGAVNKKMGQGEPALDTATKPDAGPAAAAAGLDHP